MAAATKHDDVLAYGLYGDIRDKPQRRHAAGWRDWLAEKRRAWAYRRSVEQTVRALSRVNNRTLADIGLNRSTIESAAREAADRDFGEA